jgi:hypothetical protein
MPSSISIPFLTFGPFSFGILQQHALDDALGILGCSIAPAVVGLYWYKVIHLSLLDIVPALAGRSSARMCGTVDASPLSTKCKFGFVWSTRTRTGAIGLPKRPITSARNFAAL